MESRVGDSAIELKSWVFQISTNRDLKYNKVRSVCVGLDSMVSIVKIVSLSPRVEEPNSEVNKAIRVPEQQSSARVLHLSLPL